MRGAGEPIASYADHYGIPRPRRRKGRPADAEGTREPAAPPAPSTASDTDSAEGPAVAEPHRGPASAEPNDAQTSDTPTATDDDGDQGDDGDGGLGDDSAGGGGGGRRWTMPTVGGGQVASAGAGWILGVLIWGWIVLPFVKGGPSQVGATLRAKFLNQAPDGSQLP